MAFLAAAAAAAFSSASLFALASASAFFFASASSLAFLAAAAAFSSASFFALALASASAFFFASASSLAFLAATAAAFSSAALASLAAFSSANLASFSAFLRSASSFFCSFTYSGSGLTLTSHNRYTERYPTLIAPRNSPPAIVGSMLSSKITLNFIEPSSSASIIRTPSSLPAWSCIENLRPFSRSWKSTDFTFKPGLMLIIEINSLLRIVSPGLTAFAGLRINGFSSVPSPSANLGLELVFSGSASK